MKTYANGNKFVSNKHRVCNNLKLFLYKWDINYTLFSKEKTPHDLVNNPFEWHFAAHRKMWKLFGPGFYKLKLGLYFWMFYVVSNHAKLIWYAC